MNDTLKLASARESISRLSTVDAAWPVLAGEVITQLRRVLGFDAFCASQNDPRVPLPAAALADNDAVSSRQRRFWQIEMQQPDVNKTRDLTTADCRHSERVYRRRLGSQHALARGVGSRRNR